MGIRVNRYGRVTSMGLGTYMGLWMVKGWAVLFWWALKLGFVVLAVIWPYAIKPVGVGVTLGVLWDAFLVAGWVAHRRKTTIPAVLRDGMATLRRWRATIIGWRAARSTRATLAPGVPKRRGSRP